jgi:glycosyltransferase involved in cell wall biosynthesis
MRIIHLIPSLQKGGAERLCLEIVQASQQLGHEVLLVTLQDINVFREEYPEIHPVVINAYVSPSISGPWRTDLTEWVALVDDFKPDVVHSHLFLAEMVSRHCLFPKIRYITHCHDNMRQLKRGAFKDALSKTRLTELYERHWILQQYVKCANDFIAISPDTESYFKQNLPHQLAKRIHLLPNAIDHDRFSRYKAKAHEDGPLKLINIGSFVAKKNQRFLIDVMLFLKQQGIAAELTLAGDGPLLEEVRNKAISFGMAENIHFPGNVSNVELLLAKSHLYVHSALYEPFGLVLVEAMATGLPIVSLDGNGNRELIIDAVNGYLVAKPDVLTFAKRIIEATENIVTWHEMSTNASSISMNYRMDNYIQELLLVYATRDSAQTH